MAVSFTRKAYFHKSTGFGFFHQKNAKWRQKKTKSLQKLIQNHLKINADFCMRFGSENVSKMTSQRGPIKISISSLRPLKFEKTRCFSIPMPTIPEKTLYFCMSDPTGPLKASKYGFCSKNHRNMGPTRPPNTRKCKMSLDYIANIRKSYPPAPVGGNRLGEWSSRCLIIVLLGI